MKFPIILTLFSLVFSELKVGDPAPTFYIRTLEEKNFFMSDTLKHDKPIILSFFATWCSPCAKEIPKLHELDKKFGDDLQFILIDVNEKKNKVAKHVKGKGYTLQVILDRYGKIFEAFGGTVMPLTVVVNKKGVITYHHTGYKPGDELKLEKHLKTL